MSRIWITTSSDGCLMSETVPVDVVDAEVSDGVALGEANRAECLR